MTWILLEKNLLEKIPSIISKDWCPAVCVLNESLCLSFRWLFCSLVWDSLKPSHTEAIRGALEKTITVKAWSQAFLWMVTYARWHSDVWTDSPSQVNWNCSGERRKRSMGKLVVPNGLGRLEVLTVIASHLCVNSMAGFPASQKSGAALLTPLQVRTESGRLFARTVYCFGNKTNYGSFSELILNLLLWHF